MSHPINRLALGACLLAATGAQAADRNLLAALPLRFEPAAGPGARYRARAAGYDALFTAREATLRFEGGAIGISFAGGNPAPRVEAAGPLASHSDYFIGRGNWRAGVPHYSSLRYRGVYPGIDVSFYGDGQRLEYDFLLAPGADPRRIRIRFRGADRVSLTADGDLRLESAGRELIQKKPRVRQGGATIETGYRLLGRNLAGIEVAEYDPAQSLVIDPVVYASFLGAGTNDAVIGVKVDSQGMIYVAGYTGSGDIAATESAYNPEFKGDRDIFVAKLNPAAAGAESLLYFTYIGGKGNDTPTDMTLDAAGNVYLTGSTTSTDFPIGGNAVQVTLANGAGQDAFVIRLNPAAGGPFSLTLSTYLGGGDFDIGYAIAVDPSGQIYVAGVTRSEDFPLTSGALQPGRWGEQDGFVVRLDPNSNSIAYSTYLGGGERDEARAIAALSPDRVYVAGWTGTDTLPIVGNASQPVYRGGGDIFVVHLDMTRPGSDGMVLSTFLGGSGDDEVRRATLDPQGRLLLTGFTLSNDFPVTENAFQAQPPRSGTAFLARLDLRTRAQSTLTYATYLGGTGGEAGYDLVAEGPDTVYVTGYTLSTDFPLTAGALQKTYGGGVEVFVARLNLAASGEQALTYSTYLGGTGINFPRAMAVRDGVIYLAGSAQDRAFPMTESAFQASHAGGLSDGFIVALRP